MNEETKAYKKICKLRAQRLYDDDQALEETNADRISWRENMVGPSMDASKLSDEDYRKLKEESVMDRYGRVIGYKSVLRK